MRVESSSVIVGSQSVAASEACRQKLEETARITQDVSREVGREDPATTVSGDAHWVPVDVDGNKPRKDEI